MSFFEQILADALQKVAAEHGQSFNKDAALAWGKTGACYLSYVLCSLPSTAVRNCQYAARDSYGPIMLDCKWYERLTELCMNGNENTLVSIPSAQNGTTVQCISRELFLEMLDFCREG